MRTAIDLRVLADTVELARAGAELITEVAAGATANGQRRFAIALSGGRTPRGLYMELARITRSEFASWEVFWTDERWAPQTHADSNYGLANEVFLSKVRIPPSQVHPVPTDESSPQLAAESCAAEMTRTLGPFPVFDVVLLGLGLDGHTASLFPGTSALDETERAIVANWVPQIDAHRITITLPVINRARHVIFFVSGRHKATVVRHALNPADGTNIPATAVRPYPGTLHWLLDRDAASQLPESAKAPT